MIVPYGKQKVEEEDIRAVVEVLKSDYLTQGPVVAEFEREFAKTCGAKFAVSFCNATAALHTCFKILNRDKAKKVLTTPITFAATSNSVLYEGGAVDFIDINQANFNIDIDLVESHLSKNPEAYQGIIPVDFGGLPVDMERLSTIAKKYDLWIIEDGCHAIGGEFKDTQEEWVKVGSGKYSDFTVFSFHPVKHLATGEGGMVTTNDEDRYRHLLRLRSHGIERDSSRLINPPHGGWYHEMQELGFNYRMSDINAALGLAQIKRLPANIQRRNTIADIYKKFFSDVEVSFQCFDSKKFKHAYHLFVVQDKHRRELYDFLKISGVFAQVHYLPVYLHPYYQAIGYRGVSLPKAESYYNQALSVPMFHSMSQEEIGFVLDTLRAFYLIA